MGPEASGLSFCLQVGEHVAVAAEVRQRQPGSTAVQKAFASGWLGAADTPVYRGFELFFAQLGPKTHFFEVQTLPVCHSEYHLLVRQALRIGGHDMAPH